MNKLYTVKEAAEKLKITEGTMRNYLSDGRVRHVKIFGNTRITEEELMRIIVPSSKDQQNSSD